MNNHSKLDFNAIEVNKEIQAKSYWKRKTDNYNFISYFTNEKASESNLRKPVSYKTHSSTFSKAVYNDLEGITKSDSGKHIVLMTIVALLANKYSNAETVGLFNISSKEDSKQLSFLSLKGFDGINFKQLLSSARDQYIKDFENQNFPLIELWADDKDKFIEKDKTLIYFGDRIDSNTKELNFDIIFHFEIKNGLHLHLTYNPKNYSTENIQRLEKHFVVLMRTLLDQKDTLLNEISFLEEGEIKEILKFSQGKEKNIGLQENFVSVFKQCVEKYSDKTAVICGNKSLTYKELDVQTNKLASYLQSEYLVTTDTLVAVKIDRDEWLLIVFIAILKAGGVYMPLNTNDPEDRISKILKKANCHILIDSTHLKTIQNQFENLPDAALEVSINDTDLAYVIHTSGSTGDPKGVMIEHLGMFNHLLAMEEELNLNPLSRIAQMAPQTFDISIWQLINALIVGGTTVIIPNETLLDPLKFLKFQMKANINILQIVPSYLKVLLEFIEESEEINFNALSYLLVTGEKTNKWLLEKWFDMYPDKPVVNAYGPAEASDDVTLHIMNEVPAEENVPIGTPIRNINVYVLSENKTLCPIGMTGEIYISGIGVGRGYIGEPEKTQALFLTDSFNKDEQLRMYRTGDYGRWNAKGVLEFSGRRDSQIKIRGHRIELGEIEYQLAQHANVTEAVILIKGESDNAYMQCYYLADQEIQDQEIINFLLEKLPDYMVPSQYLYLNEFPLTPNGKINKKALAEIEQTVEEIVPPSNDIEKTLVEIWSDILKMDKELIGIENNFFDLGGHSLSIMILSKKIENEFQVPVSIPNLFTNQTIKSISKLITTELWFEKGSEKSEDKIDIII